jgi:hypothetical protein
MRRFSILALVLLAAAFAASLSSSQERDRVPPAAAQAADAERPMSIFNDKVRRFKFELEETLVTAEVAENFMLSYQGRKQPAIIGAYADAETNALVVISAPEAEEAIRVHLATWMVDRQGLSTPPLKVQKRTLEFRRKNVLEEMAQLEVQGVGVDQAKAEQLHARLAIFKAQLDVVERQIEIVQRYTALQNDAPAASAKSAAVR